MTPAAHRLARRARLASIGATALALLAMAGFAACAFTAVCHA